tara:strand:- start:1580 stop:2356 length:777 start_codon:yes stop_codon:yes gene_type:complete
MINKKYLQLIRSSNKLDMDNFIYNIIAERIKDSIDLLNIEFKQMLEIGINDNINYSFIQNKFINSKIDRADVVLSNHKINKKTTFYEIDIENINIENNYYDLIYSNFFLHLTNNFERTLRNIFNNLNTNGFFIATLPSKECMYQLLNSMYEADLYFYNGAFQRFNPTIEIDNILPIMKILNFYSPSIHTDTITVYYKDFKKLLNDVRKMNLTYCYLDKKQKFEKKNYFRKLEEFYKNKYFNKNYILEIKINVISAWKK